jgi:hypothetical protein
MSFRHLRSTMIFVCRLNPDTYQGEIFGQDPQQTPDRADSWLLLDCGLTRFHDQFPLTT